MTHHATFNLSPTHKTFSQLFYLTLLGLPSLRNEEVASFFVKYCPYSWSRSLLIFCPMALVFTLFNSAKTLFAYGMCYNELRGRMLKLDALKETGKSHIWPYLRATKWRRDWTPDVLSQLLHTLVLTCNWSIDCLEIAQILKLRRTCTRFSSLPPQEPGNEANNVDTFQFHSVRV